MPDVLGPLRSYLVAQGLARVPKVAGSAPPLYLQPRLGLPAPGEPPPRGDPAGPEVGPDVVLGLTLSGGFATGPYESYWRLPTVDLRLRVRRADMAQPCEQAITALLIDRRDWTMGGVHVIESLQTRPLQPLGSDAQAFDYVVGYRFQVYAP